MRGLAAVVFWVSGIVGLFMSIVIVAKAFGAILATVALFLFPVTFTIAPWYAALKYDNWVPLAVGYGGWALAGVLMLLGGKGK